MDYTISNLKNDLAGILHSTSLNKVKNQTELINRAARTVIGKIDPDMTKKISQITNAVHDSIFDYTLPSDLKGKKVIDIRPQINREANEQFSQKFSQEFDVLKKGFQIRHNAGTKSLRLKAPIGTAAKVLHNMNSLTSNGTWTAVDDATNLTLDTLNKFSGSASLNFDVNALGSTGSIELASADMTQVDLSDLEDIAQLFVQVYIPDPSIVTNWILRWGSSASAYWTVTVTAPHDQDTFKTGWQTLAFDWNGATKTGSPDSSAIDYLKVTVTYDGTVETDIRVDKISASSGVIYEIEYYSENLFRSSSGTYKTRTTDDTDIVNLDEDSYNILLNEVAYLAAQQQQGADATFDRNFFREELYGNPNLTPPKRGLYDIYETDHPGETIRPRSTYYNINLYH